MPFHPSWIPFVLALAVAGGAPLASGAANPAGEATPRYRQVNVPLAERVDDLLGRMTLEEKVAQLGSDLSLAEHAAKEKKFDPVEGARRLRLGLGTMGPVEWDTASEVNFRNAVQIYVREHTRLGIPVLFHEEGCHGVKGADATVFPAPIGFACAWDPDLMERAYAVVARELRARGVQFVLAPVVDICRDPRWGRCDETLGEDPFLNGTLGTAIVFGFQGRGSARFDHDHVAATLKHFTGHGQPEGGINRAPADIPVRLLRETHLVPFEMVVAAADPAAVMPSYNEIDGVPSHGSHWLLQDVLRGEFRFHGLIASDYNGISDLTTFHHVAANSAAAALLAFRTGVQMDLPQGELYAEIPGLVASGALTIAEIDVAVRAVLRQKFALGLFENSSSSVERAVGLANDPTSKALALEAARKSIVLLKNQDGILPLAKGRYKKIAVIGPDAAEAHLGGYSGDPRYKISLLDGIREKTAGTTEVVYAEGCKINKNHPSCYLAWKAVDELELPTAEENRTAIADAVRVARDADLIVLAIGENESISRESWMQRHRGDRPELSLFGAQQELADALFALGKPIVVYLMNGRPLAIPEVVAKANAVIEGWYMGQETGHAAADILFGDVNPSGKLTISFPRSAGHLPVFYNHKPSLPGFGYVEDNAAPLFPFGFGLSYTTFDYGKPEVSKTPLHAAETATVSAVVTNSGRRAGDEIVQLYIRDRVSSVTRPVKELKGFRRITLAPGEAQTVSFKITPDLLAFYNADLKRVVEPGEFEIFIGPSSTTTNSAVLEIVPDAMQ